MKAIWNLYHKSSSQPHSIFHPYSLSLLNSTSISTTKQHTYSGSLTQQSPLNSHGHIMFPVNLSLQGHRRSVFAWCWLLPSKDTLIGTDAKDCDLQKWGEHPGLNGCLSSTFHQGGQIWMLDTWDSSRSQSRWLVQSPNPHSPEKHPYSQPGPFLIVFHFRKQTVISKYRYQ